MGINYYGMELRSQLFVQLQGKQQRQRQELVELEGEREREGERWS